jgi:hypothetical protein
MSRPRFLTDHDLNEHIIDGVLRREPSIDLVRCRDVGLADRPDPEVLEYAASQERIVLSHDVNTMPQHARTRVEAGLSMSGLLMIQQLSPVGQVIEDLILIWSASEAEEWRDQIRFLPL